MVLSILKEQKSTRMYIPSVNGTLSDRFSLQYGVLRGSCLGPVLFIIYASKLVKTVNAHLPDVYCCEDDSHLYHFLKPNS